MKRDSHGDVTRDTGVTSRRTTSCDNGARSRVSHATTTPPHRSLFLVAVACGVCGEASHPSSRSVLGMDGGFAAAIGGGL